MFFSKKVVAPKVVTKGRKSLSKTTKVLKGHMIYINKSNAGTSYRIGTPTKAIIAAGITKLYGTEYAYSA